MMKKTIQDLKMNMAGLKRINYLKNLFCKKTDLRWPVFLQK